MTKTSYLIGQYARYKSKDYIILSIDGKYSIIRPLDADIDGSIRVIFKNIKPFRWKKIRKYFKTI